MYICFVYGFNLCTCIIFAYGRYLKTMYKIPYKITSKVNSRYKYTSKLRMLFIIRYFRLLKDQYVRYLL